MSGSMAENLPRTTPEFINWSRTHAELWAHDPESIGLTPAQAEEFAALAEDLGAAQRAAVAARQASVDATRRLSDALARARATGGVFIGVIKTHAAVTGNPGVYSGSGVSPAARQGTLPPPTAPQRFSSRVNPDGSLTIRWKVRQPVGVTDVAYLVYRRLGAEREFTLVGSEGTNKSFTDAGLPVGVGRVEYIVRAKRGEVWGGSSEVYLVQFGTVGRGEEGAGAVGGMKMAA